MDLPLAQARGRNSTMDLLRVMAILSVICHHLILNIADLRSLPGLTGGSYSVTLIVGELFNSFFIIGVNLFFLLSGYFGLNPKKGKILSLVAKVYIYVGLSVTLKAFAGGIGGTTLFDILSRTAADVNNLWFMFSYVIMYFFSPFLNFIAEKLTGKNILYFIAVTTVIFCIMGFFGNELTLGMNGGYSPLWGSIVYIYGRIISRNRQKLQAGGAFWGLLYILFAMLNFVAVLLMTAAFKNGVMAWKLFGYNNPLVLGASVSFFMAFLNINIGNKKIGAAISAMAQTSMGVYIIQTLIPFDYLVMLSPVFYVRLILIIPDAVIVFAVCAAADFIYNHTLGIPVAKLCYWAETLAVCLYSLVGKFLRAVFLKPKA